MMRRTSKIMIEIVIVLAVGAVISVAALMWRLSRGPISLGVLTPHIARMLTDASSLRVKIDDTILVWPGWGRPVDLRALTVSARGSDGALIAVVPELSVRLSFRALLRGEFRPVRLIVHRPVVQLVRSQDGDMRMGVGTEAGPSSKTLDSLVQAALSPPDSDAPLGYLRRASIVGGTLRVEDRALGIAWSAPEANIGLTRDQAGAELNFDFSVALPDQTPKLSGVARIRTGVRKIDIDSRLSSVWPSRLARTAPLFETLRPMDFPVSARAKFTLDFKGDVVEGVIDLSGGAGRLALPDVWPKPVAVRSVKVRGDLMQNPRQFVLREFEADLFGPRLGAHAELAIVGGVVGVSGDVTVRDLPIADFIRFWPAGRVVNGRRWVKDNITSGTIPRGKLRFLARADVAKGEFNVESISGTFDARRLTVHYFRPLIPLHAADARGRIGNDFLQFDILGGEVNGVRATAGLVRLDALDTANSRFSVDVNLKGAVRNVLEVIDHPRLGYAREMGVVPATVGGTSESRLKVAFPLLASLTLADTDIRAESEIRGLSVPDLVADKGLSKGAVALRLDKRGVVLSGRGEFAGIPSDIGLNYRFRDRSQFVSRATLKATVEDDHLERLGLGIAPYVAGPLDLDLLLLTKKNGRRELAADIDLGRATLGLSMLGWSKPAGEKGEAAFRFLIDPGRRARLHTLRLQGGGLEATGTADFALEDGWVLKSLKLDRVRLGNTDVGGTLTANQAGGYDVDIAGPALDGAPFLVLSAGGSKTADVDLLPPMAMKLRVAKLILAPDRSLASLSGRGFHDGVRWRTLSLSAGLGGKGTVSLDLSTKAAKRVLGVSSNDAGAVLQRFGVTDGVRGGNFFIEAQTRAGDGGAPWSGRVLMKDFRVRRTPVFARLATLASLSAIGDRLAGRGIRFARMEAPLMLDKGVIEVKNVRAIGSQLGLTADGRADLNNKVFDMKGTLVPAYTLNSLISHVPLLGQILTGAERSGIFAVSYTLKGGFDDPKVSVNPLSVVAPGFLRNLVDVLMSGEAGVDVPEEIVDP